MVEAEDLELAGKGDLAALRRMRDHWFDIATGQATCPLLPRHDALAQLELLAQMAAINGEFEDSIGLIATYNVRIEVLERDLEASEGLTRAAVEADDVDSVDRWSSYTVELLERLALYQSASGRLVRMTLHDDDATGAALLVSCLTMQADKGDERAVGLLQTLMDCVSPERAAVINAKVRTMEKESAQ